MMTATIGVVDGAFKATSADATVADTTVDAPILYLNGSAYVSSTSWVSPTGKVDDSWTDSELMYDGDTGTHGWCSTNALSVTLTHAAISCSRVRIWSARTAGGSADLTIEVYYSAGWHTIHNGLLLESAYQTIEVGSTESITAARITMNDGISTDVAEFQFQTNTSAAVSAPFSILNDVYSVASPYSQIVLTGVSGAVTYLRQGTTYSYFYGGDTSGDSLEFYSNTSDAACYLKMTGNAGMSMNIASGAIYGLSEAAGSLFTLSRTAVYVELNPASGTCWQQYANTPITTIGNLVYNSIDASSNYTMGTDFGITALKLIAKTANGAGHSYILDGNNESGAQCQIESDGTITPGRSAGVAKSLKLGIPIDTGGSASQALTIPMKLGSTTVAGVLAETDGSGSFQKASFKIPYYTGDYGAAWGTFTTPESASIDNGAMCVAFNQNIGAFKSRLYVRSNGSWTAIYEWA